MSEEEKDRQALQEDFSRQVGKEAERRQRARREKERSLWFGLGAIGVVGWSIAIPTLLGILIGLWLDANWPRPFSWTLTLMITGLIIGCLVAWQWVREEMEKIKRNEEEEPSND